MLVLPFKISETEYSLFVAFGKENLDRIAQYDPAEINLRHFGDKWNALQLKDIIITYATEPEVETFLATCREGNPKEAMRHLTRGFKFKPEAGDADMPFSIIFPLPNRINEPS